MVILVAWRSGAEVALSPARTFMLPLVCR
jgi:hypothetical protein